MRELPVEDEYDEEAEREFETAQPANWVSSVHNRAGASLRLFDGYQCSGPVLFAMDPAHLPRGGAR